MTPKEGDQDFRRGFKSWCENVALQVRKEMGVSQNAPIDPRHLAKNLNVVLWKADEVPEINPETLRILTEEDPESWSALTLLSGEKRLVILNPANSPARQNSDLSHELSHLIIGHEGGRIDITPDNLLILHNYGGQQENEANWLAGCLLLPRPALLHVRKTGMDDKTAMRTYGVSQEMFGFRVNVTGVDWQTGKKVRRSRNA